MSVLIPLCQIEYVESKRVPLFSRQKLGVSTKAGKESALEVSSAYLEREAEAKAEVEVDKDKSNTR